MYLDKFKKDIFLRMDGLRPLIKPPENLTIDCSFVKYAYFKEPNVGDNISLELKFSVQAVLTGEDQKNIVTEFHKKRLINQLTRYLYKDIIDNIQEDLFSLKESYYSDCPYRSSKFEEKLEEVLNKARY